MNLDDLPWMWIAAAAVAAVIVVFAMSRWRPASRSYRPRPDSGHGSGQGNGPGMPSLPEQKALLTAANHLREAMEKQARQMEELRTFWSRRLDELDRKIAALAAPQPQASGSPSYPQPGQDYGRGYAAPYDSGMYGAESPGMQLPALEAAWGPGPGDQPVEIRDGVLVVSRSLPPAGYVSAGGSGQARVYLNADVPLTEFSLPKWAAFFELQGARPYAAYRTRRPAEVRWDEGAGRGELISKGLAEAI